ncbi:MAG: hypothetical protein ACRD0X_05845 [Thermoanaerobaculia bacterium]
MNDREMVELPMPEPALANPEAPPQRGEPESSGALRLRALLRERCSRLAAPEALRQRILASLPHRSHLGAE